MTTTWIPVLPLWLVLPVLAGLLGLLAHGTLMLVRKRIPRTWIIALTALRLVAVLLFVTCLLRPVVSRTHPTEQKPRLVVLLDASRSMGLPTAEGAPRLRALQESLRRGAFREHLDTAFDVSWFAFDRDARPVTPGQAAELEPAGETTDWANSLETAWNACRQQSELSRGAPPSRVLLASDGNDHGLLDPVETARRLGATVYALPAPDTPAPVETQALYRVEGAQGPGRVLLGSECRFRVAVRRLRPDEQAAVLTLTEDGQAALTHEFQFAATETERSIPLVHRPTTAGIRHFGFHLSAPGTPPPATNATAPYELSVQVLNRNTRVLILEDAWRWEFKFLRRLLEEDPSFTFVAFLARSGGTYMQFAEPDSSLKLGGFPQSRAELEWFDLFILGDVQPQRWPENVAPALHELVVERGRSLIFLPGPRIGRLAAQPQMEALIPVQVNEDTRRPVSGPVNARITREGYASPFFYTPPGDEYTAVWKNLTPMDQIYAPLRKKPAATILLEAPDRTNPFGNLIIMAEHTVGRGRVLYIGTDTLWKWHTVGQETGGNTPYRLFWQQTLRALSPARQSDTRVQLDMQTDRARYTAGQTMALRLTREGDPGASGSLEAYVELPDQRRLPLAVRPDAAEPRVFRADCQVLLPGRYRVAAELFEENRPVADVVSVFDVAPVPAELEQAQTDLDALDRLATRTGGRRIDLQAPDTWPARTRDEATVTVTHTEPVDLWQRFVLLFLLALVLGADWLIRLLKGYV